MSYIEKLREQYKQMNNELDTVERKKMMHDYILPIVGGIIIGFLAVYSIVYMD